jgi:hypothetical protein
LSPGVTVRRSGRGCPLEISADNNPYGYRRVPTHYSYHKYVQQAAQCDFYLLVLAGFFLGEDVFI